MTLDDDPLPPRVYHLMPRGISKGAAIAWDLERRGLTPADAVAIGDSVSDLEMAPAVGRLWITANGAAVDGMAGLHRRRPQRDGHRRPDGRGLGPGGPRQPRSSLRAARRLRGAPRLATAAQDVTSRRAKCRNASAVKIAE